MFSAAGMFAAALQDDHLLVSAIASSRYDTHSPNECMDRGKMYSKGRRKLNTVSGENGAAWRVISEHSRKAHVRARSIEDDPGKGEQLQRLYWSVNGS